MKPRIFISAVTQELGTARQLTANVLTRLGCEPISQDILGTEAGDLIPMLQKKIDDCDGLIHLVGFAYGFEPSNIDPDIGRASYTQLEFLYARQQRKKTWLIYADEGCSFDRPLSELDLPVDGKHADVNAYQLERRNLQSSWRERWNNANHLKHTASSDAEFALLIERLHSEFPKVRGFIARLAFGKLGCVASITFFALLILIILNPFIYKDYLIAFNGEINDKYKSENERLTKQLEIFHEENMRFKADVDKKHSIELEKLTNQNAIIREENNLLSKKNEAATLIQKKLLEEELESRYKAQQAIDEANKVRRELLVAKSKHNLLEDKSIQAKEMFSRMELLRQQADNKLQIQTMESKRLAEELIDAQAKLAAHEKEYSDVILKLTNQLNALSDYFMFQGERKLKAYHNKNLPMKIITDQVELTEVQKQFEMALRIRSELVSLSPDIVLQQQQKIASLFKIGQLWEESEEYKKALECFLEGKKVIEDLLQNELLNKSEKTIESLTNRKAEFDTRISACSNK